MRHTISKRQEKSIWHLPVPPTCADIQNTEREKGREGGRKGRKEGGRGRDSLRTYTKSQKWF